MKIGVVADDITGAGDVGSLFRIAGWSVVVVPADAGLDAETAARSDVVVVDTDSRFDPPDVAHAKVRAATRALRDLGAPRFYKKTCSVFRGNVGAELDAMMEVLGEPFGVALAAFPRQGRTTVDGVHRVHGVPLAASELARDPAHPCTTSDLAAVLATQTSRVVEPLAIERVRAGDASFLEAARSRGVGYLLAEAETQEDVASVARLLARTGARVVLGSSALAEELPGAWRERGSGTPAPPKIPGGAAGVLVVAGSTMPQTRAQVAMLAACGHPVVTLPWSAVLDDQASELSGAAERAAGTLARGRHVVLALDATPAAVERAHAAGTARGLDPRATSKRLSRALADAAGIALERAGASGIVVLGGDTSEAVCARLGIGPMRVVRALAPGLPLLCTDRRALVLKSGSFGDAAFVERAIRAIEELEERRFPADFVWGAATSAYQIEGAAREDGRGESVWDVFARTPGKTARGETGDVACDHYHRMEEDVDLLAGLGLGAYRFSVSWSRIFPDGLRPNPAGIAFYDRLVDRLLARGVSPCVTLNHWDMPQALEDRGGWPARDTALRFAGYAEAVMAKLGDRVPRFLTHNEPWCVAHLGYYRGVHAPGRTDLTDALAAAHHLLYSHGLAVGAARAVAPRARVGIALSLFPTYPRDPSIERAARLSDGTTSRWYLDPVYRGAYPDDALRHFESLGVRFDFVRDGDLAVAARPTDFLGINYYHRRVIDAADDGDLGWKVIDRTPGVPTTDLGWEIVPHCFTDLLVRLDRDYGSPSLLVTENGAVFDDEPPFDDERRVAFIRAHVTAAHRAVLLGAKLEGYFAWSLMDNYEWAFGYGPRFGLVHVDYATQRRTPKASARFFGAVAAAGGLVPASRA